jgi:hypothetical protein
MNPKFKLAVPSALDLEIQGSLGAFQVKHSTLGESIEVKYIQSHIGFDVDGQADKVLSVLAPVREVFDFQSLDFSEIMQRDIDDVRVSHDLIGYILDEKTRGAIKFFPPIVIAIVPVDSTGKKPERWYPAVETTYPVINETEMKVVQSGSNGAEAFRFECPWVNEVAYEHDQARLKISTHHTKLVILDGQHRAMALLALYRNYKVGGWADERRKPFETYYRQWDAKTIESFNFKNLKLPVLICAFPELDAHSQHSMDVPRAVRQLFLTLNKNARPVTRTRNILLDDNDLIAELTRSVLSHVKNSAEGAFRIWNVELDQENDKTKVGAPMALTGISHVHYIVEHAMMAVDDDLNGIKARSGKFYKRVELHTNLGKRLHAEDLLGKDVAGEIRRRRYSDESAAVLKDEFETRYGKFIRDIFENFDIFRCHNTAAIDAQERLAQNAQIQAILFEGQGIGRTFDVHYERLLDRSKRLAAENKASVSFNAQFKDAKATKKAVDDAIKKFEQERLECFAAASKVPAELRSDEIVVQVVNRLYENVFTTIAFQAALVCGFFQVIESAEREARLQNVAVDRGIELDLYLKAIHTFFRPSTWPQFKRLVKVFSDAPVGETLDDWKPKTNDGFVPVDNFGRVVSPGEMKPDEWPKYRYLLIELWSAGLDDSSTFVASTLKKERGECRKQVHQALLTRNENLLCAERNVASATLSQKDRRDLEGKTLGQHNGFLKLLLNQAAAIGEDEQKGFLVLSGVADVATATE